MTASAVIACIVLITGCGQKGGLYLPDNSGVKKTINHADKPKNKKIDMQEK